MQQAWKKPLDDFSRELVARRFHRQPGAMEKFYNEYQSYDEKTAILALLAILEQGEEMRDATVVVLDRVARHSGKKTWKMVVRGLVDMLSRCPAAAVYALHKMAIGWNKGVPSHLRQETRRIRAKLLDIVAEREEAMSDSEIREWIEQHVQTTPRKNTDAFALLSQQKEPFPPEEYYTLEKAAEVLGITIQELMQLVRDGEIPAYRDGDTWKFKRSDIEEYKRHKRFAEGYYSFEKVRKELQLEEDELRRLVEEGEIRAFRDDDRLKIKKSDVEGLKKGRMTEPTIILPAGEEDDSEEDPEVLFVEEDASETFLDIDDLDDSPATSAPTTDFSADFEVTETITEELTFAEDSGSYVLESSNDVLIDSSGELTDLETPSEDFDDSDVDLPTEPLGMDIDTDFVEDGFGGGGFDSVVIDSDFIDDDRTEETGVLLISEDTSEMLIDVDELEDDGITQEKVVEELVTRERKTIWDEDDEADDEKEIDEDEWVAPAETFRRGAMDPEKKRDASTFVARQEQLLEEIEGIGEIESADDLPTGRAGGLPETSIDEFSPEERRLMDSDTILAAGELEKLRVLPEDSELDEDEVVLPAKTTQHIVYSPPRQRRRSILAPLGNLFVLIFKIPVATIALLFGLSKEVFTYLAQKIKQFIFSKSKEQRTDIPLFEKALSEDAGRPGAFERVVAQSTLLLRTFQATIGLRFILVAHTIDAILNIVTGYINGIFQAWKFGKTLKRRMQRRDPQKLLNGVIEDLTISRYQMSRLFGFAGFRWEQHLDVYAERKTHATFALKLALELRNHLDEMKRDLAILTVKEAKKTAQKTIWDFLKSFIPNPFELFTPCKDLVILLFVMKYQRREIEVMYADLVTTYQQIIVALECHHKGEFPADYRQQLTQYQRQLAQYERDLLTRLDKDDGYSTTKEVEHYTGECRQRLQRIVQMLCSAYRFVEPRYWQRFDLLCESAKIREAGQLNSRCAVELERWLTAEVERALRKKGAEISFQERQRRWREAQDLQKRYHLQRMISRLCL